MITRTSGFTLLELLIAAILIAILTMFATQAFRKTSSDIRVENAKRGADTIAAAAFRFRIAYPDGTLKTGDLSEPATASQCLPNADISTVQKLVNCGFLENRRYWDPEDFSLSLDSEDRVTVTAISSRIARFYESPYTVYTTSNKGIVSTGYN